MARGSADQDSEHAPSHSDASPPVFQLVHRIRREVEGSIDTVLSWQELSHSSCDFAIVRPLVKRLSRANNPALLYALLLTRTHFLEEAEKDLAFQGVNATRAALCELLASKLTSLYDIKSLQLATVLTTVFNPFTGVSDSTFEPGCEPTDEELQQLVEDGKDLGNSALELAVESGAKKFIGRPAVQQLINALYTGQVIYRPTSSRSIIEDNYKSGTSIEAFDMYSRPLLDHYILKVPRVRRAIEFSSLAVLVVLFMVLQRTRDIEEMEITEKLFILFSFSFTLEELVALKERGLGLYFSQFWNMLDMGYMCLFSVYFVLRMVGVSRHRSDISTLSFDVLAIGACLLFPRLCGIFLKDSLVLLGLRAMLADFVSFIFLAGLCSAGFLLAFSILGEGAVSMGQIAWILVKVFLGSSYLGFEIAPQFGAHIGPALMLIFAVFSNTLLLTILISILTNTFSMVQFNVVEETMYQKAVNTLDLVKADALFEFAPLADLVALPLLLPANALLNPRRFHQFNVFLIRTTNFPILLVLTVYYRLKATVRRAPLHLQDQANGSSDLWDSLPRGFRRSASERVFERPVTAEGAYVAGIDGHQPSDSKDSQSRPAPLVMRGSGGREALGMKTLTSHPASSTTVQATSLLSQLVSTQGGGESTAGTRIDHSIPSEPASSNDKYVRLEEKLDSIEKLLEQLLTGGLKSEDHDVAGSDAV